MYHNFCFLHPESHNGATCGFKASGCRSPEATENRSGWQSGTEDYSKKFIGLRPMLKYKQANLSFFPQTTQFHVRIAPDPFELPVRWQAYRGVIPHHYIRLAGPFVSLTPPFCPTVRKPQGRPRTTWREDNVCPGNASGFPQRSWREEGAREGLDMFA